MPLLNANVSKWEMADAVGWFRFVETRNGLGVHAGLFETSMRGEPLGFCFIKGDFEDFPAESGPSILAEALYRARNASPALLLCLAGDLPSRTLHALNFDVPLCCLSPTSKAGEGNAAAAPGDSVAHGAHWANRVPGPQTAASGALDRVMQLDDPFEPFERAAKGMAEAFADGRVQSFMDIRGLRSVVSWLPRESNSGSNSTENAKPPVGEPSEEARGKGKPELAERLREVLAPPLADYSFEPSDTRLEWPSDLMPFQRDGVHALIEMDRLLLSDDMGLGKTVQAVAALRILKVRGKIGSCLVVAPASVLDQWRRELARWAPELSAIIVRGGVDERSWQWRARKDVKLVGYDIMRQDAGFLATLQDSKNAWSVVVLDEAQRIKNRNETSNAAKKIPRLRSWALTGTPIENDEEELASIMEFVDHVEGSARKRYHPGAALRRRHGELQLRRRKRDVLHDLPPKLETRLTIPLLQDQRASYDRAERDGIVYLKSLGAEVGVQHILELITRLKQICNADPRTGASSKLNDIGERMRKLADQGHKALIFSQYTNEVSGVGAAASFLRAFDPLTLTGDTPSDQRSKIIDRFRIENVHKALIISLRAGGLGLNLQEASYVFHLDRWWNPAVERQAEDRSHRLGQTVKVNVIKYTCENTIEERIDQILQRKQDLFDQLVDDVSMDLSTRLNRKELLALFGL